LGGGAAGSKKWIQPMAWVLKKKRPELLANKDSRCLEGGQADADQPWVKRRRPLPADDSWSWERAAADGKKPDFHLYMLRERRWAGLFPVSRGVERDFLGSR